MDQLESNPPLVVSDKEPAALREKEASHIFDNYSFDHTYSSDLPITSYRQQIVDTIESNSVTVIQGMLQALTWDVSIILIIIKFSTSDNAFRILWLVDSILVISSYTLVWPYMVNDCAERC